MRTLLDHLDALVESLSLRVTNDLFDALSHPKCLSMLLFLLADISARSTPVIQDVRKSYRYPYLVTNILANGSMGIRDVFIASEPLVAHLLSFLDGNVVLSAPSSTDQPDNLLPLACENPIIVGNVVQILVSYLETSPDALLNMLDKRPSFLPSLVNLLSIGSAPKLLVAIVPDRCVDDVASMDHCNVSFDAPLTKAVTVLANGTIFHNLANAFVLATQTIYSRISNPVEAHDAQEQSYVEQLSYNVIQVYSALVRKLLRAVRINTTMPACQYLNVFATSTTASTISEILRAGIELFRETKGKEVSTLDSALSLIIDLFRYVEQDRERRVASVTGQPPALDTSALEAELKPFLRALMFVLIDVVYTGQQHASIRLRILEVFVECTRVCSNDMLSFVSELRFASVALKVMLLNPKNSVMQHVVCRGVETALISNVSCAILVHHWLIRAKLIEKVITTWENECGDQKWGCPRDAQQAPFLSALVHIACCIQHYLAIQAENPSGDGWPQVGAAELKAFEWFCTKSLSPILAEEVLLCGPKPRRRLVRGTGNIGRSFGVLGSTSGGLLRRSGTGSALASGGAHLVRSPSAHRFGYVPPVSSLRSRFDEVFVEGGDEEFGAGSGCSSLVSVFDLGDALG